MTIINDLDESFVRLKTDNDKILDILENTLSCYESGYEYSPRYKRGLWDGKKEFFKYMKDELVFMKGLVPYAIKKLNKIEEPFEYNKSTPYDISITQEQLNQLIVDIELPFKPYDFQQKMVLDAINNKRRILVAATGSGKSLVIYLVTQYLIRNDLKGVLIVPSIDLTSQMFDDFKDYGAPTEFLDKIRLIGGNNNIKLLDKQMTISTWQSAIRIEKDAFNSLDFLLVDEGHRATADALSMLIQISSNCSIRIGLTGTLPEEAVDKMSLLANIGEAKQYITARGLIERGLATDIDITTVYLNHKKSDCTAVRKLKYPSEVKFIKEHQKRNNFVAKFTHKLSKKGNTLLLYNHTEHGKDLYSKIHETRFGEPFKLTRKHSNDFETMNKKGLFFVAGEVDADVRKQIRQILEDHDDAVIVGNFSCLSTGINIKKLKNLVFGANTKSFTTVIQSIGRVIRTHVSKDKVHLFDIVDDFGWVYKSHENYVLKHFSERLSAYMREKHPVRDVEINL